VRCGSEEFQEEGRRNYDPLSLPRLQSITGLGLEFEHSALARGKKMRAELGKLSLCLGIVFEETVLVLSIELHKFSELGIFNQAAVTL
jgi:hypothetical protein